MDTDPAYDVSTSPFFLPYINHTSLPSSRLANCPSLSSDRCLYPPTRYPALPIPFLPSPVPSFAHTLLPSLTFYFIRLVTSHTHSFLLSFFYLPPSLTHSFLFLNHPLPSSSAPSFIHYPSLLLPTPSLTHIPSVSPTVSL